MAGRKYTLKQIDFFQELHPFSYHLPSADSPEGSVLSHGENSMVARASP